VPPFGRHEPRSAAAVELAPRDRPWQSALDCFVQRVRSKSHVVKR
jgi:hypothetical protein